MITHIMFFFLLLHSAENIFEGLLCLEYATLVKK
jgi:hypothetical protein